MGYLVKYLNTFFLTIFYVIFVFPFFLGCSGLNTQKTDIIEEINTPNNSQSVEDGELYDFVLGVGDSIDISVYRKKSPEFILGIGDTIDLKVHRKNASEFILGKGDTVGIDVYRQPDLSRNVKISPSGTISLPLVGEVTAEGYTTSELSIVLQSLLQEYLVNPQVMVSLVDKNPLILDELSDSYSIDIQTGGRIIFPVIGEVQALGKNVSAFREEIRQKLAQYIYDPQVTIKVTPLSDLLIRDLSVSSTIDSNGQVTMPLVGDINVVGKKVKVLRKEIQERLSEFFDSPQVVIKLSSVTSQEMYVLGEVVSTKAIPLATRTRIWESIIKTGGYTDDANPHNVILIRQEKNQVRISSLDLEMRKLIQNGNQYVHNGDIIYVPPSNIANFEKFMIRLNNILTPFLTFQRAFIFLPEFIDVLNGSSKETIVTLTP